MPVCYQPSPEGRKPVPVSRGVGTRSRQRHTVATLQSACPCGEHVESSYSCAHRDTAVLGFAEAAAHVCPLPSPHTDPDWKGPGCQDMGKLTA